MPLCKVGGFRTLGCGDASVTSSMGFSGSYVEEMKDYIVVDCGMAVRDAIDIVRRSGE